MYYQNNLAYAASSSSSGEDWEFDYEFSSEEGSTFESDINTPSSPSSEHSSWEDVASSSAGEPDFVYAYNDPSLDSLSNISVYTLFILAMFLAIAVSLHELKPGSTVNPATVTILDPTVLVHHSTTTVTATTTATPSPVITTATATVTVTATPSPTNAYQHALEDIQAYLSHTSHARFSSADMEIQAAASHLVRLRLEMLQAELAMIGDTTKYLGQQLRVAWTQLTTAESRPENLQRISRTEIEAEARRADEQPRAQKTTAAAQTNLDANIAWFESKGRRIRQLTPKQQANIARLTPEQQANIAKAQANGAIIMTGKELLENARQRTSLRRRTMVMAKMMAEVDGL
ncbi:hypothetical protein CC86DRAFT_424751 [Ophiobolus disseminans]|uniref:Uncharacterized protein n=1 Tax=Ophiobolus disseminans TaxID=1469910 RepID=A0A6A7AHA2_9PLEO|nr:hypothetical protein CC86DRAFT_424751 [Ophiobolus disseminans]